MVWNIIFVVSGALEGWVLYEAGIKADSWLFWAIILNTALSQFAIAKIAIAAIRERAVRRMLEFYQDLLDDLNKEDDHGES